MYFSKYYSVTETRGEGDRRRQCDNEGDRWWGHDSEGNGTRWGRGSTGGRDGEDHDGDGDEAERKTCGGRRTREIREGRGGSWGGGSWGAAGMSRLWYEAVGQRRAAPMEREWLRGARTRWVTASQGTGRAWWWADLPKLLGRYCQIESDWVGLWRTQWVTGDRACEW